MNLSKQYLIDLFTACKGRDILFDNPNPGILIRHDVDDNLLKSLECAELQNKVGIKSTYFILDTAPYFRPNSKAFWHTLRFIQEMGHSVEWHNNAITRYVHERGQRRIQDIVTEILDMFFDNGVNITGSASHGDRTCYNPDGSILYLNHQIFTESVNQKPLHEKFTRLFPEFTPEPLNYYKLDWEAYHVPYDKYYSEPGGRWGTMPELFEIEKTDNRIQVLIHPQWWIL